MGTKSDMLAKLHPDAAAIPSLGDKPVRDADLEAHIGKVVRFDPWYPALGTEAQDHDFQIIGVQLDHACRPVWRVICLNGLDTFGRTANPAEVAMVYEGVRRAGPYAIECSGSTQLKYIPTQRDCDVIKAAAAREGSLRVGAVLLEPGLRHGPLGCDLNIAKVTNDPQWGDTDLADYGTWAEFRKGVELTDDGRAVVDFYISRKFDQYRDLKGNVTCYIVAGELAEVRGYDKGHPIIWSNRMKGSN